jgi:uncharacterized protein YlxW (UPF0749 family)
MFILGQPERRMSKMKNNTSGIKKTTRSELERLKAEIAEYREKVLDLEAEVRRLKKKVDELENETT